MPNEAKTSISPKLRFPEFRQAKEWMEKELRIIADPVSERPDNGDENNILTLSAEQGIVLQNEYFGKQIAGTNADRYLRIQRDDFVYNDRVTKASAYGTIKRLAKHPHGIVSPIYKCFRFKNGEQPGFWEWYFEAGAHEQELRSLANEGARAGRFNVSIERFLSTSVRVPDPGEQQKIAKCLSTLDELVGAESQKLDALKAHKKGLMQQLFPREGETLPRLRFPEFQKTPEWREKELGPMTRKVGSGITPLGGNKNYKVEGRPFIRSQNVGWGELILDDVAFIDEEMHLSFASTEIEEHDVLLNITGASIGRSAIADSRIAGGNVNQHVCIVRLKPNELNPVLLNQYLISQCGQKQIDRFQAGGNRQGLNFAQIRSLLIPFPPTEDEQQRIASCLSSLDDLIAAHNDKLEALRRHKKGLLQQLFPSISEVDE